MLRNVETFSLVISLVSNAQLQSTSVFMFIVLLIESRSERVLYSLAGELMELITFHS